MDDANIRLSHQEERPNHYAGHFYNPGTIDGKYVHLGDNYYATEGQRFRRPSTGWEARPSLGHAASNADHLYIVPRSSTIQFTGRRLETQSIEQSFHSPLSLTVDARHKIVVLYGLGGSGKTQVCLRYAETSRAS